MQRARLEPLIQLDLQIKPPVPEHAIRMFKKPAAMKSSKCMEKDETRIARQPMYINAKKKMLKMKMLKILNKKNTRETFLQSNLLKSAVKS